MKYLKLTFEYFFILEKGKRFLLLFMLALPMGISLAFLAPNAVFYNWILNYKTGDTNFWHAWNFYGQLHPLRSFLATLAIIITTFISYSIMATVVSRSMRVGKFKIKSMFYEINENFFAILSFVITAVIVGLIFKSCCTLFFIIWQSINIYYLSIVLSALTIVVFISLLALFMSYTILFIPYMTINGLKANMALTESLGKFYRNRTLKMFLGINTPIIVSIILGSLAGFSKSPTVPIIVDSILYTFLSMYILVLSFISYYDVEGLERQDYTQEYYYKNRNKSK